MSETFESALARMSRKVAFTLRKIRGSAWLTEPLRRRYAAKYMNSEDRWGVIRDFDGDLKFRVDRSAFMGSCMYWRGFHHVGEIEFLRRWLRPDMVFLDVGANQGEFTVFAARRLLRGRVIAFEPVQSSREQLHVNLALNQFRNVTVCEYGLSDATAQVAMYTSGDLSQHHSFHEGLFTMYPSDYRSIQVGTILVKRLDDVAASLDLNRLDMMKIDVEGAELRVLQGSRQTIERYRPVVIMEMNEETFHSAGYSSRDVVEFWRNLNYRVDLLRRDGSLWCIDSVHLPELSNVICQPADSLQAA